MNHRSPRTAVFECLLLMTWAAMPATGWAQQTPVNQDPAQQPGQSAGQSVVADKADKKDRFPTFRELLENPTFKIGQWTFTVSGTANVYYVRDEHADGETTVGNDDSVQFRRGYVDLVAERKLDDGMTFGGKVRVWLEPTLYGADPLHLDGFGTNDSRATLDFLNEVEAYINNIPLDSKKVHLISVRAGKGYVAFGFDRPEEQISFTDFPMIHPLTKAGGLGQVMHARVTYKNVKLGLEIDGEVFEPNAEDTNRFDIDLPDGFANSYAVRVRKSLPMSITALGSYARIHQVNGAISDRFTAGAKYDKKFSDKERLTVTVEVADENKTLTDGRKSEIEAYLAQASYMYGKNTYSVRYERLDNPARMEPVESVGANYMRNIKKWNGGKGQLNFVAEANRIKGVKDADAMDPTMTGRIAKKYAAGINVRW